MDIYRQKWPCAFLALAMLLLSAIDSRSAEMTVSAAASLTNAFSDLKTAFEKKHPDITVQTNFAASNPLLKQIMEGAPVDVFASADQDTMNKAVEAKVANPDSRKDFALNELVLITPKGAPQPASLADLAKAKRIAVGNPDSVPAGRYAKAALVHAGLWDKLEKHFIYSDSVRQALDYVARGEVDAGFVYKTDALLQKDKTNIALLVDSQTPVSYPIALALTGDNPKAGQEFIDFVLSPEGMAILAKYGFSKP